MTDAATGQRSFLQGLKVPFDLKGVALGALAYLALVLGARCIGVEGVSLLPFRLGAGLEFHCPLLDLEHGKAAWLVVLWVFTWAILGVACSRVAAMRIARDEGVGAREALGFAFSNLKSSLAAIVFFAATAAFFYGCIWLAGCATSLVPAVGAIALLLLLPLILLAAVLLFLVAFGATLGFPLVGAAIATERNGALDAVSRSFSYVYSRFMLFLLYAVAFGAILQVMDAGVSHVQDLAVRSFRDGTVTSEGGVAFAADFARGFHDAQYVRLPGGGFTGTVTWLFALPFHLVLRGFVVYYAFGACTAMYFALRHDVDGTEDEEIWVEGEDEGGFGEPERPEPPSSAK